MSHSAGASAQVINTPGHTVGHISYFIEPGAVLLCGDTLFSLGCGKLLEGTAADMFGSLRKLAVLPDDTVVCCGHEYTQSNAKFAVTEEPENTALQDRAADVGRLRSAGQPTVPSRLGDELAQNPFLPCARCCHTRRHPFPQGSFPVKLFHAPASPFARKVMACAIARGVEDQITLVPATGEGTELAVANPLGKLPCLITDDGVALYDSRVICEFLDTVGNVFPMFPEHGMRFRALRFQALGDGISDAAVLSRGEGGRPSEPARDTVIAIQKGKMDRSLDVLEQDPPSGHVDVGSIAVACALGYLDLRFAAQP